MAGFFIAATSSVSGPLNFLKRNRASRRVVQQLRQDGCGPSEAGSSNFQLAKTGDWGASFYKIVTNPDAKALGEATKTDPGRVQGFASNGILQQAGIAEPNRALNPGLAVGRHQGTNRQWPRWLARKLRLCR